MGRREDLLRREAEGWRRVSDLVEPLTPAQVDRPGLTPAGWSVKDLLWHLAFWHADAARALGEMREGVWDGHDASLVPGWTDRTNDEQQARSQAMGLAEVRAASVEERRRMLEVFGALEEPTPAAMEWFEESGPLHTDQHLPGLAAWAARLRSGG
jgi:hypothetical protein